MDKKRVILLISIAFIGFLALLFDKRLAILFVSLQNSILTPILRVLEPLSFVLFFALIIAIMSLVIKKKRYVGSIVFSVILSTLVSFGLKFIIMRPRPFGFLEYIPFTQLIDYSFPSSHAVAMFALLPILSKEFKSLKWLWWALAIIVSFTRLYFGVHYLSDVILGGVIGYLLGYWITSRIKEKE